MVVLERPDRLQLGHGAFTGAGGAVTFPIIALDRGLRTAMGAAESSEATEGQGEEPKQQITVALSDLNIKDQNTSLSSGGQQRVGLRPALGTLEDDLTQSTSTNRSLTALSFRLTKKQKKERVGVNMMSDSKLGEGVFVTGVDAQSPAALLGVQDGDRIVSINGKQAVSATQAAALLKTSVGDVEVVIERGEDA